MALGSPEVVLTTYRIIIREVLILTAADCWRSTMPESMPGSESDDVSVPLFLHFDIFSIFSIFSILTL